MSDLMDVDRAPAFDAPASNSSPNTSRHAMSVVVPLMAPMHPAPTPILPGSPGTPPTAGLAVQPTLPGTPIKPARKTSHHNAGLLPKRLTFDDVAEGNLHSDDSRMDEDAPSCSPAVAAEAAMDLCTANNTTPIDNTTKSSPVRDDPENQPNANPVTKSSGETLAGAAFRRHVNPQATNSPNTGGPNMNVWQMLCTTAIPAVLRQTSPDARTAAHAVPHSPASPSSPVSHHKAQHNVHDTRSAVAAFAAMANTHGFDAPLALPKLVPSPANHTLPVNDPSNSKSSKQSDGTNQDLRNSLESLQPGSSVGNPSLGKNQCCVLRISLDSESLQPEGAPRNLLASSLESVSGLFSAAPPLTGVHSVAQPQPAPVHHQPNTYPVSDAPATDTSLLDAPQQQSCVEVPPQRRPACGLVTLASAAYVLEVAASRKRRLSAESASQYDCRTPTPAPELPTQPNQNPRPHGGPSQHPPAHPADSPGRFDVDGPFAFVANRQPHTPASAAAYPEAHVCNRSAVQPSTQPASPKLHSSPDADYPTRVPGDASAARCTAQPDPTWRSSPLQFPPQVCHQMFNSGVCSPSSICQQLGQLGREVHCLHDMCLQLVHAVPPVNQTHMLVPYQCAMDVACHELPRLLSRSKYFSLALTGSIKVNSTPQPAPATGHSSAAHGPCAPHMLKHLEVLDQIVQICQDTWAFQQLQAREHGPCKRARVAGAGYVERPCLLSHGNARTANLACTGGGSLESIQEHKSSWLRFLDSVEAVLRKVVRGLEQQLRQLEAAVQMYRASVSRTARPVCQQPHCGPANRHMQNYNTSWTPQQHAAAPGAAIRAMPCASPASCAYPVPRMPGCHALQHNAAASAARPGCTAATCKNCAAPQLLAFHPRAPAVCAPQTHGSRCCPPLACRGPNCPNRPSPLGFCPRPHTAYLNQMTPPHPFMPRYRSHLQVPRAATPCPVAHQYVDDSDADSVASCSDDQLPSIPNDADDEVQSDCTPNASQQEEDNIWDEQDTLSEVDSDEVGGHSEEQVNAHVGRRSLAGKCRGPSEMEPETLPATKRARTVCEPRRDNARLHQMDSANAAPSEARVDMGNTSGYRPALQNLNGTRPQVPSITPTLPSAPICEPQASALHLAKENIQLKQQVAGLHSVISHNERTINTLKKHLQERNIQTMQLQRRMSKAAERSLLHQHAHQVASLQSQLDRLKQQVMLDNGSDAVSAC